ncbi:hypothetical protein [Endozoicomonas sp. YOMI1]|uniref:hypothetical protein n=1 Tax=Endozoicomonas sp. YOMI1 TaxID=2828739 RepID=UPI00214818DA|nr:hypothetical protein [Endozoicomonas sp. YOMI1]
MYFALEPALMRIFGTPELMMKTVSWQLDINSGYRKTTVAPEYQSTRDERLGDHGIRKGDLRERMNPELFAILTIRYDDNQGNRSSAWLRVTNLFRNDERLPKAIRKNPVMLSLYLMWLLQHPDMQQKKGKVEITGKSRKTLYRWRIACQEVCSEWIKLAEGRAEELLEEAGAIKYEN